MRGIIKEFKEELMDCHEISATEEDISIVKELLIRYKICIADGEVSVNNTGPEELISIDCDACGARIIDSDRIKIIQENRQRVASK